VWTNKNKDLQKMLAANRNAAKANLESRIHERELTNKREELQLKLDAK
jgi:hypothetical protein